MRPNLSLITLGVSDLKTSFDFYTQTLGWTTKSKLKDGVIFFPLNGVILGLFPKSELAKDAQVAADGSGFPGFSLAHNAKTKAEVDAIFADLKRKGVTIMKLPHDVFWGGYSGYFADPDGYLWEVAWNPHWKLDEEGRVMLPA